MLGERIIIVIAAVEKVVHIPVCPLQTVVRLQPLQVVGQVEITTIFASTTNVQNSRIGYDAGHQQQYKFLVQVKQSGERVRDAGPL